MTEIIRNILAFSSTFVVITFACAIIFQLVACAFNKGRVNDKMKKKRLDMWADYCMYTDSFLLSSCLISILQCLFF